LLVIDVTGARRVLRRTGWRAPSRCIASCATALPPDYALRWREVFAGGGRMMLATEGMPRCVGVAVWRVIENTYEGVPALRRRPGHRSAQRSRGIGSASCWPVWKRRRAGLGCDVLALDSGTQRTSAHRFYFAKASSFPVSASGKPFMKPINVGLLGIGTVGGGTFNVLSRNQAEITRRAGRPIRITKVADKNLELARKVTGDAGRR
jgi:hypothetical protein